MGDILTPNIKKTVGNEAKIYYRAMPSIPLVHFLDAFADPSSFGGTCHPGNRLHEGRTFGHEEKKIA